MPYPGRKVHDVLPKFANSNVIKPTSEERARWFEVVVREYQAGRSLRELAESTGRTQTAVRRALDGACFPGLIPSQCFETGFCVGSAQ